jgi:hypothetical protein
MNAMEKFFAEFAEKVLEQTMCDVCLQEFPDEEMRYDEAIRDGAPVCARCYARLTGRKPPNPDFFTINLQPINN